MTEEEPTPTIIINRAHPAMRLVYGLAAESFSPDEFDRFEQFMHLLCERNSKARGQTPLDKASVGEG